MNLKINFKNRILLLGSRVSIIALLTYCVLVFTLFAVAAATFLSAVANPVDNQFTFNTDSELNVYISGQLGEKALPEGVALWGANTKYVTLTLGNAPSGVQAYVRVMLVPVVYNEDGTVSAVSMGDITVGPSTSGGNSTWQLGDMTVYLNPNWSSHWTFRDGFFYYDTPLSRGAVTLNIFQGFSLDNSSGIYDGKTFTIELLADAIDVSGAAEWGIIVP